ncbi:PaaI family thioesterase [Bordetella hinzii]|uniref:PaaI family thioesterase n=1 Tax=Bordetella hinzii TaxID=103855 RepID=UPI0003F7520F|nr:PaaI family thioesterase [Bordetella hinzii]AKQ55829.1 Thioesterase superfamily protein [Bordetella hinzii]KCB25166.1 thioesterase family protein [Bordetella hinzii L60]MCJ9710985.1 PaaI family thioesterase [Bordetella hinzii]QDJ34084.1 phenylacetic acid degradation protein [Bordetella hinzii]QDJ52156.1 phenylacetic acid degradation protein [Bordetella hinzii]
MDKNLTHDMLREAGWGERRGMGFSALVGPLWSRREGDGWAYGLLTGEQHANQAGLVHGGLLATLMDQALSAVAWEALQRQPCVTVQLDTHYLAAARPGQFLEARGTVLRATSSLVFVQGDIRVGAAVMASGQAVLKRVRRD